MLRFYYHPFAAFCQKALIALYENGTAFKAEMIDLGDPGQRAALEAIWPMTKFPVLRDEARDATVPESSLIIEYLGAHYPGPVGLIPQQTDAGLTGCSTACSTATSPRRCRRSSPTACARKVAPIRTAWRRRGR